MAHRIVVVLLAALDVLMLLMVLRADEIVNCMRCVQAAKKESSMCHYVLGINIRQHKY